MHVLVNDLPPALRAALASVDYGRKDVAIEHAETVSIADAGGDGYRAFAIVINLSTGASETHWGSWGGANAFNPRNAVDLDTREHALPPDGAIVRGCIGGGRPVSARIVLSPACRMIALPAAADLSDREIWILAVHGGIKAGYRRDYLQRASVQPGEIDALVSRGLLSRNRAGAVTITTAGKNARGNRSSDRLPAGVEVY